MVIRLGQPRTSAVHFVLTQRNFSHGTLLLAAFPRYNQAVLRWPLHTGFCSVPFLICCALWAGSCAMPIGPGYVVEKQEIRVQFVPAAQSIQIEADYELRNTGIRPIGEMKILLPGGRRLHHGPATIKWDGSELPTESSTQDPRNSILRFEKPWPVDTAHSLRISYEILPAADNENALSFAPDAFYLPAAGWSPELPQIPGLFGFGGVPPKKWELIVTLPQGFLVHTSGTSKKALRQSADTQTIRALQTVDDRYPFVVAGRYSANRINGTHQTIIFWSRASSGTGSDSGVLRQASSELARTIDAYNESFGAPLSRVKTFWIVECPVPAGCISRFHSSITTSLEEDAPDAPSAELASSDTVMVDPSKGAPTLAAAAAPPLAASWLGYGRNPGFYEQTPPLSQLPIFAAAQAREVIDGPQSRADTIRRTLRLAPKNVVVTSSDAQQARDGGETHKPGVRSEDQRVLRAKSFLFFYALQDRYGPKVFHDAIAHMLYARATRGFDLDDLIAAFEQETHQNVAQFVRLWMKHPGVPEEFRSRYANPAADTSAKQPISRLAPVAGTNSFSKGDLP